MAAGPIPLTAILEYARHYGFSQSQTDILIGIIRTIDSAWLNATARKRAAAAK